MSSESANQQSKYLNVPSRSPVTTTSPTERSPLLSEAGQELLQEPPSRTSNSGKLGTFDGVYIPVVSAIWGAILFLRVGYIMGRVGLIGTLAFWIAGYCITIATTLSLAAISTNGTVKGGGPYYLISRSLGPEFGGSIGIIIFLGGVLNGILNVLAFVEAFLGLFGSSNGLICQILPEDKNFNFLYGSIIWISTLFFGLMGSRVFSKISLYCTLLLTVSTLSVVFTFIFRPAFSIPESNIFFTGISLETLNSNLWPDLNPPGQPIESYEGLFGVLFPACIGILAGASMSGNLRKPSKSIPKGTLWGVFSTLTAYLFITIMFAATTSRETLVKDMNAMSDVGYSSILISLGILSTSFSSCLSCMVGAAKIFQAISRDELLSFLKFFSYGTPKDDEPKYALYLSFILGLPLLLAGDINVVACIVTMFFCLTFCIINLACLMLRLSSAPNFRPSFKYFNSYTAGFGVLVCLLAMLVVSPAFAFIAIGLEIVLFSVIHLLSPPKPWGDITQSIIYHQVRKYLLRLDYRKTHVKYWRPQILFLVNNPYKHLELIQFMNHLKKGSLYILGHLILSKEDTCFDRLKELHEMRLEWLKLVDDLKIKAFVQLLLANNYRWGALSLILGSGLGGMTPNVVMLGEFPNPCSKSSTVKKLPENATSMDINGNNYIPLGPTMDIQNYVGIIEDVIGCNKAIGIAFNFDGPSNRLFPLPCPETKKGHALPYIDLWPIQTVTATGQDRMTTNFDSYTLVLQLGCILHMIPQWSKSFKLRVCSFVEDTNEINQEKSRIQNLLNNLRITAEINIIPLDQFPMFPFISSDPLSANQSLAHFFSNDYPTPSSLTDTLVNHTPQIQCKPSHLEDSGALLGTSLRINIPKFDHSDASSMVSVQSEIEAMNALLASDAESSSEDEEMSSRILSRVDPNQSQQKTMKKFNDLTPQKQLGLLNQVMSSTSSDRTKLIISTLPVPVLGTYKDRENCWEYNRLLHRLVKDLPPTLLVHSESLTVTNSL